MRNRPPPTTELVGLNTAAPPKLCLAEMVCKSLLRKGGDQMQKAVRPQLHIDRRSEISSDYHRHGIAQVVPNHLSLFGDPFAGTVAHRFLGDFTSQLN